MGSVIACLGGAQCWEMGWSRQAHGFDDSVGGH